MDAREAVAKLFDNPVTFLASNSLRITGRATLDSGEHIFTMSCLGSATVAVSGTFRGKVWSKTREVDRWDARVTADPLTRVLRGRADYAEFRAFYVAMRQIGDDPYTTHYSLPASEGPDLMLTSQLTGCTFGYGSQVQGGACLVSHMQPARGRTTERDKVLLKRRVLSPIGGGGTALETTGETQITVIGHRTNGTWQFYRQVMDGATRKITVTYAQIK